MLLASLKKQRPPFIAQWGGMKSQIFFLAPPPPPTTPNFLFCSTAAVVFIRDANPPGFMVGKTVNNGVNS